MSDGPGEGESMLVPGATVGAVDFVGAGASAGIGAGATCFFVLVFFLLGAGAGTVAGGDEIIGSGTAVAGEFTGTATGEITGVLTVGGGFAGLISGAVIGEAVGVLAALGSEGEVTGAVTLDNGELTGA